MSISIEKFKEIKLKYGNMSSWAIWKEKDIKEKSKIGDLSIFENFRNIRLNPNVIFLGLNISQKMHPFSFAYIGLVVVQYPSHAAIEGVCSIRQEHRAGQA